MRTLLLADGRPAGTTVNRYFTAPVQIGNHEEICLFFVTRLGKENPVILGLPWLQRHNPSIDWSQMSVKFTSEYCQTNCCPPWLDPRAPCVPFPTKSFHDLPIPGEPRLRKVTYHAPSVEEVDDEDLPKPPPKTPPECAQTRKARAKEHRANSIKAYNERCAQEDKAAAERPGRTRYAPAPVIAGQRRWRAKPEGPYRLFRTPPCTNLTPSPAQPSMEDIKVVKALNFAKFCQQDGVQAMLTSWDEIYSDEAEEKTRSPLPEEITGQICRDVALGRGEKIRALRLFPKDWHDVIEECYDPLRISKVTDTDIEKFMKGKPAITKEELEKKLPPWLHDMIEGWSVEESDKLPPRRPWDHKIDLEPGKTPPYSKPRPVSPGELRVIRKWLDDNLSKGFIRESRAKCAAPLLLAAKPGGGVRICQDYRGLNNVTIKNRYPLPLVRETLDAICRAKVYTKLDIIAAFNKLRIAEGDEWKTAFICRYGLFESVVMPFGLCNAPSSFQHYINHALGNLLDRTCTAYLDDVLIFSEDKKEHRKHVREVVQRLIDAGLQIDINKCEFETTRTKYLGLIVTPGGLEMDPEKIKTIQDWEAPTRLKDLQKFLGFANFYRRFIQDFSAICRPLNDLTKKEEAWRWGEEQQNAFQRLKDAFSSAPVLAMFDYAKKTILETDASDWASGGVLSQYDDKGILRPVAYFSAKHSATECNYEIYDKELLAIIKCLEEWRPELQGTRDAFEILTDHKNLEYFTTTKALNQRQVRWSEFLASFNFKITYRPGSKAVRPDALSRKAEDRPLKTDPDDDRIKNRQRVLLPPDRFDQDALTDLLREAANDEDLAAAAAELILPGDDKPIDDLIDQAYQRSDLAQTMLQTIKDSEARCWPKAIRGELRIALADCVAVSGRVYYRGKLFVPPDDELKSQILYRNHSSGPAGHPGKHKTTEIVMRQYWWPKITRDVQAYVKACDLCVRIKASRSAPAGFLQPLPLPFQAWSDISVDYITPLPPCDRSGRIYNHVAVVVCRLTKMRHFIATETLSAEELADAFVSRIYSLHGCPETIISDRGSNFISEFWRQLSSRLGIILNPSSAYHPETDGQTERLNAVLEQYLRAYMNFAQDDWVDWLPLAEFASNNVTSETTGYTPFFANYGFNPRFGFEPRPPCSPDKTAQQKKEFMKAHSIADRFERIMTQLRALAAESVARYEENANDNRTDAPVYQVGQRVWLSTKNMKTNRPMKKGDDKWAGPFEVTAVYRRALALDLPNDMKIFPVFHNNLVRPYNESPGLKGQERINEAESRKLQGRILEREDGEEEPVEKWKFDDLLDSRRDGRNLEYLIKWSHHGPTWQPASDLKGQDQAIFEFHDENPDKPGPPSWAKRPKQQNPDHRKGRIAGPAGQVTEIRRSARLALKKVCFSKFRTLVWF